MLLGILWNPLGTVYTAVTGGVPLHVRTCTPHRCISETAWPIAFKFAVRWGSRPAVNHITVGSVLVCRFGQ